MVQDRISHRKGAVKTWVYINDHRKQIFYVGDKTKSSCVCINVHSYNTNNTSPYEFKCHSKLHTELTI